MKYLTGLLYLTLIVMYSGIAAADVLAYKDSSGVFTYVDDIAKVPTKYRADVTVIRSTPLREQARVTVAGPEAGVVSSRLGELREEQARDRAARREAAARAEQAKPAPPTTVVILRPIKHGGCDWPTWRRPAPRWHKGS